MAFSRLYDGHDTVEAVRMRVVSACCDVQPGVGLL